MPIHPSVLAQLRLLCAEPCEDDGVISRRRPEKNNKKQKSLLRFAGEAVRFLNTLLPSAADPILQQVLIIQATLHGEQLRIEVQCDHPEALARLMAARPWLRSELAAHVPTRRVPELFFTMYHEVPDETP